MSLRRHTCCNKQQDISGLIFVRKENSHLYKCIFFWSYARVCYFLFGMQQSKQFPVLVQSFNLLHGRRLIELGLKHSCSKLFSWYFIVDMQLDGFNCTWKDKCGKRSWCQFLAFIAFQQALPLHSMITVKFLSTNLTRILMHKSITPESRTD